MVRKAHLEKLNQAKKTKQVSSKSVPNKPRVVIPSELNYGVSQSRSNNRSQCIPSELNYGASQSRSNNRSQCIPSELNW